MAYQAFNAQAQAQMDWESAEQLAMFLLWESALDGPFSGGPGDHTQAEIDSLVQGMVSGSLVVPDLLGDVGIDVEDICEPMFTQYLLGGISAEQFSSDCTSLVSDSILSKGGPIIIVDVRISNGF